MLLNSDYSMKKHNFCAGPSILPKEIIIQAAESVLDINESGLSLLEISHRSKAFIDIMEEARSLVLELTNLNGKDYSILFLQGGASTQFSMVPYNILSKKAAYLDTGSWSSKAIKEAKLFGDVKVIASSKDSNYNHIPDYKIPDNIMLDLCDDLNTPKALAELNLLINRINSSNRSEAKSIKGKILATGKLMGRENLLA